MDGKVALGHEAQRANVLVHHELDAGNRLFGVVAEVPFGVRVGQERPDGVAVLPYQQIYQRVLVRVVGFLELAHGVGQHVTRIRTPLLIAWIDLRRDDRLGHAVKVVDAFDLIEQRPTV